MALLSYNILSKQLVRLEKFYRMNCWIIVTILFFSLTYVILDIIDGISNGLTFSLNAGLISFLVINFQRKARHKSLESKEILKKLDQLEKQIEIEVLTMQESLERLRWLGLLRQDNFDSLKWSTQEQLDKLQDQLRRRTAAPAA